MLRLIAARIMAESRRQGLNFNLNSRGQCIDNGVQDDIRASLQLVLEAVSSALAPTGADLTVLDSIR